MNINSLWKISVKGIWTNPPEGWPVEQVPFCDPNNGCRMTGKPRKEILLKMFYHLVALYAVSSLKGSVTGIR